MNINTSSQKTALLLLLFCIRCLAQNAPVHGIPIQDSSDPLRGAVEGVVQDEGGRPLENATVTATPPGPLFAILPNTKTDIKGRFRLAGLIPGTTILSASKVDAFYADTGSGLWSVGPGSAKIEVRTAKTVSGILLTVSPAARLQVRALDEITGHPIESFVVYLQRAASTAETEGSISGNRMNHQWLVPTAPILVRVDAVGFDSAWYSKKGGSGQPTPLIVRPRETLAVDIRLHAVAE